MRKSLLLVLTACGASLLHAAPLEGQAIYDDQGHLTSYLYADGKRDSYSYDSSWRMTSFTGRDGVTTQYSYAADGSIVTQNADGSIVTNPPAATSK